MLKKSFSRDSEKCKSRDMAEQKNGLAETHLLIVSLDVPGISG
jgi:hypothetical protein